MNTNPLFNDNTEQQAEASQSPQSANGTSVFGESSVRSEMMVFNATCHYAERISPGVTNRMTVADFAAVHQGTLRAISSITLGNQPIFGPGSLPELKIGPVTNVFSSLVQSASALANSCTRAILSPVGQAQPAQTNLKTSTSKTVPKPKPGKGTTKAVAKKEKGRAVSKEQRQNSAIVPSTSAQSAVKPKAAKSKVKLQKTVQFTADVSRDTLAKKAVTKNIVTAVSGTPKATSTADGKNIVNRSGAARPSSISNEDLARETNRVLDVQAKLKKSKKNLNDKCMRSYESPSWKVICNKFGIEPTHIKDVINALDDNGISEVNKLRTLGVAPLISLGLFPEDRIGSMTWADQMDLEDLFTKARNTFLSVKRRNPSTGVKEKNCLADYVNKTKVFPKPFPPVTQMSMNVKCFDINELREVVEEHIKVCYATKANNLFINLKLIEKNDQIPKQSIRLDCTIRIKDQTDHTRDFMFIQKRKKHGEYFVYLCRSYEDLITDPRFKDNIGEICESVPDLILRAQPKLIGKEPIEKSDLKRSSASLDLTAKVEPKSISEAVSTASDQISSDLGGSPLTNILCLPKSTTPGKDPPNKEKTPSKEKKTFFDALSSRKKKWPSD